MTMNQPVGDNARKGAVRKRSQLETTIRSGSGDRAPALLRQLAHLHAPPS
jgi:hypothetical protein